jgi:WbqC-like protein family
MIVSINQPAYLPWLGYFHRIAVSDLHIVLDHVQFEKNSFVNRNKVRTRQGSAWLTVPVRTKGRFGELPIDQLEIDNSRGWAAKHWETMRQSYSRAPHFSQSEEFFRSIYAREWTRLADLLRETNEYIARVRLGIETPMKSSSSLGVSGSKSELVLNLCKSAGATVYLSGPLGRGYLDEASFAEAGIELRYHDYNHPTYPQFHGAFEAYMSVIDLLFNCGDRSREILSCTIGA